MIYLQAEQLKPTVYSVSNKKFKYIKPKCNNERYVLSPQPPLPPQKKFQCIACTRWYVVLRRENLVANHEGKLIYYNRTDRLGID